MAGVVGAATDPSGLYVTHSSVRVCCISTRSGSARSSLRIHPKSYLPGVSTWGTAGVHPSVRATALPPPISSRVKLCWTAPSSTVLFRSMLVRVGDMENRNCLFRTGSSCLASMEPSSLNTIAGTMPIADSGAR